MVHPPIGKHPMFAEIVRSLRKADGGYLFAPDDLAAFGARAVAIEGGEELYLLCGDLLLFAAFLHEHQGSPEAAQALLEMAAPVVTKLERVARDEGSSLQKRADAVKKQMARERDALTKPGGPLAGLAPKGVVGVGLRKRK